MQKKLTKLQAYNAIITFVDKYYWSNQSENVSNFITYAFFWPCGGIMDGAAWPEWQDALKLTARQDTTFRNMNKLTRLQALRAMVNFFKHYCSLYGEIPEDMAILLKILEDLHNNKQKDPRWLLWMESIDEVVAKQDPRFYIKFGS